MHYENNKTISGLYSASENEDIAQCKPDYGERFWWITNENFEPLSRSNIEVFTIAMDGVQPSVDFDPFLFDSPLLPQQI